MISKDLSKLTIVAISGVIAFFLMIFIKIPIIPAASFLTLDISIIPALLIAANFGIWYGVMVIILRSFLVFILANHGAETIIGMPINFALATIFLAIFIFLKNKKINEWLSGAFSILALIGAALIINYFFAIPLYAEFAKFDIAKYYGVVNYLISFVIPFNLIEGIIWTVMFVFIFPYILPAFKRLR